MLKIKRLSLILFSLATVLLAGCSDMVILHPKGQIAADELHLLFVATGLMLIIVIPVLVIAAIIVRKYRASNTKSTYTPTWSHSYILEALWWIAPIIIISILAVITWVSTHALDPYKPLDIKVNGSPVKPLVIQAIALRWRWLFVYPEQNIATINYIQFPVNRPISFHITSDAPMNSFQIPALGGQIYAMNGMRTQLHLIANHLGSYAGRSVFFSGAGFSDMMFTAKSSSNKSFDQWVAKVKRSPKKLDMSTYQKIEQPHLLRSPPQYFSPVDNRLFHNVIYSFLTPKTTDKLTKDFVGVTL